MWHKDFCKFIKLYKTYELSSYLPVVHSVSLASISYIYNSSSCPLKTRLTFQDTVSLTLIHSTPSHLPISFNIEATCRNFFSAFFILSSTGNWIVFLTHSYTIRSCMHIHTCLIHIQYYSYMHISYIHIHTCIFHAFILRTDFLTTHLT